MLQTDHITEPLHRQTGTPEIPEFVQAIQGRGIIYDMVMDMSLIYVSRHQKCVLPLGKTHGQLVADFIGFLRRNFPRFEGLADLVGNHIMLLRPSGHLQILAFGEKEFLIGSLRVTLVGADIFATVGFLCIL